MNYDDYELIGYSEEYRAETEGGLDDRSARRAPVSEVTPHEACRSRPNLNYQTRKLREPSLEEGVTFTRRMMNDHDY